MRAHGTELTPPMFHSPSDALGSDSLIVPNPLSTLPCELLTHIVELATTEEDGTIDKQFAGVLSLLRPFSEHAQALMFRVRLQDLITMQMLR